MRRRIAMNKLPRHVKRTFYCEECDRCYSIRYMDRHHRTYKRQRKLLIQENVPIRSQQHLKGVNKTSL